MFSPSQRRRIVFFIRNCSTGLGITDITMKNRPRRTRTKRTHQPENAGCVPQFKPVHHLLRPERFVRPSIPTATRDRVKAAAAKFNYLPSMIACTLQGERMQTIRVFLPEFGEGYRSQALSGVGDLLIREGYFYFTIHHRHKRS